MGFLIEQRLAYKPRGWSWVLSADSKLDSYEDPMYENRPTKLAFRATPGAQS